MEKGKLSSKELHILEVAKEVFAERGFHGTTVDEIAKRAGVAKGTLYLYFKSKEELFVRTLEHILDEVMQSVYIPEEIDDPLERLKEMVRRYLEYLENHRRLFGMILHDRMADIPITPHGYERKIQTYKKLEEKVMELMKKCIEAGYLKPIEPLWLASAITGLIGRFVLNSLIFTPEKKLTELYPLIIEFFLDGAMLKKEGKEG